MLSNIHWSSWTATRAVGRGVYSQVVCTPDCAHGHEITTTVPVVLSGPVKTASGDKFSTMTLNAGGDDPETVNILN